MLKSLILSRASFKEVMFWLSGGMESPHHLWTSAPMLNHPCCEHFFSLNQNFSNYIACVHFFLPFHCAPPGGICLFLLYNPTLWKTEVMSPRGLCFSRLNQIRLFPSVGLSQSLSIPVTFPLDSFSLSVPFLYWVQNFIVVSQPLNRGEEPVSLTCWQNSW